MMLSRGVIVVFSLFVVAKTIDASCPNNCSCNGTTVSCVGLNLTKQVVINDIARNISVNATTLIFDDNDIDEFPTSSFQSLPRLTRLSVRSNVLISIPTGLQSKFPNLKSIDLSENLLEKISTNGFVNLTRLTELYLDGNRILYLDVNIFKELSNLTILSLASTALEYVDVSAFNGLTKLKILNLERNEIADLPVGIFDSFSSETLVSVNLSSNQLKSINNKVFNFRVIDTIDLSNNEISSVAKEAFSSITKANFINLNNNLLNTIFPMENLADGIVDIQENPLECNCKLLKQLNRTTATVHGHCRYPQKLSGADINMLLSTESVCLYCDFHQPCLHQGDCFSYNTTDFHCFCQQPFGGKFCEIDSRGGCHTATCPRHSQCVETSPGAQSYTCECLRGYEGNSCTPSSNNNNKKSEEDDYLKHLYLGISILVPILVVLFIFLAGCYIRKYRKHESYMVVPDERSQLPHEHYSGL